MRCLLFLEILHQVHLNHRERVELFLDLYGNNLITERSQKFVDSFIPEYLYFLAEEKKCKAALKNLVSLHEIKFKERDEMSDIVKSWKSTVPFEMEKHRD